MFERDATTWLAYWMLGCVAFAPSNLGPLMPFLRAEMGWSYTQGGLLFTVLAVGMILAGLSADRIAGRWGRHCAFWGGGTGTALGALCLAIAGQPAVAVAAALILGFSMSLTVITIQSILSDRHGEQRAIALTESNVLAAGGSTLAPLLIGGFQRMGIGWRGAPALTALVVALIAARFHTTAIPRARGLAPAKHSTGRQRALPASFWAFWVVIVLSVSIEWCLLVWGADYLEKVVGLSRVNASTAMSVFLLAMLIGRAAGSHLTHTMAPLTILFLALWVCLASFVLFWLAPLAVLNLTGLFLAGLGVANLFPLAMSVAVGTAPGRTDIASARVFLGTGLAVLITPLFLGWVADQVSLRNAYAIVVALLVGALAVIYFSRRVLAMSSPV